MTGCSTRSPVDVELYFYGELADADRTGMEQHIRVCAVCRQTLEELTVIRDALAARSDVAAPPGGDWTGFSTRLQAAVAGSPRVAAAVRPFRVTRSRVLATLAAAALLALVTFAVLIALREHGSRGPAHRPAAIAAASPPPLTGSAAADEALLQVSEAHFERAKLVVLGLATKDPAQRRESWSYERELATSLLDDTRLYRQTAEESGMHTLAGVMRDLEIVLLQTAMAEQPDAESLAQLQRLIRRRDLITKMNVVATTGLLP